MELQTGRSPSFSFDKNLIASCSAPDEYRPPSSSLLQPHVTAYDKSAHVARGKEKLNSPRNEDNDISIHLFGTTHDQYRHDRARRQTDLDYDIFYRSLTWNDTRTASLACTRNEARRVANRTTPSSQLRHSSSTAPLHRPPARPDETARSPPTLSTRAFRPALAPSRKFPWRGDT